MKKILNFLRTLVSIVFYITPSSHKKAKKIMGKNFLGVKKMAWIFKVTLTKEVVKALEKIPFSEATLKECKNTHVLVAKFPLSILEIRGKVEPELFNYPESALCDLWYNKQSFAKEQGEVSWQLVRKTPVSNSTDKVWNEQQALLNKNDEVPTAQTMTYTIIGHYLATSERLCKQIHVRTSSTGMEPDGFRFILGFFDEGGLNENLYCDGYARSNIGLSVSRKF